MRPPIIYKVCCWIVGIQTGPIKLKENSRSPLAKICAVNDSTYPYSTNDFHLGFLYF